MIFLDNISLTNSIFWFNSLVLFESQIFKHVILNSKCFYRITIHVWNSCQMWIENLDWFWEGQCFQTVDPWIYLLVKKFYLHSKGWASLEWVLHWARISKEVSYGGFTLCFCSYSMKRHKIQTNRVVIMSIAEIRTKKRGKQPSETTS